MQTPMQTWKPMTMQMAMETMAMETRAMTMTKRRTTTTVDGKKTSNSKSKNWTPTPQRARETRTNKSPRPRKKPTRRVAWPVSWPPWVWPRRTSSRPRSSGRSLETGCFPATSWAVETSGVVPIWEASRTPPTRPERWSTTTWQVWQKIRWRMWTMRRTKPRRRPHWARSPFTAQTRSSIPVEDEFLPSMRLQSAPPQAPPAQLRRVWERVCTESRRVWMPSAATTTALRAS
mmetsp:Transcript_4694/g.13556  ORF Transcript_4694/g.13556 Transcript_4694/m.13556 type:complete len:232 (-) Transcript_4694:506-1201(-)